MKWLKYATPLILPKIVYRQGFMLLFLSNENSNETGAFSPFCKSVKGPVFTGLFGLFTSYKCLILLTFLGNIFRYLRICFLICRNPSTARNQFGSNPTRVRIPLSAPKRDTFCVPLFFSHDEARLFFDYCDAKNECILHSSIFYFHTRLTVKSHFLKSFCKKKKPYRFLYTAFTLFIWTDQMRSLLCFHFRHLFAQSHN